MSAISLRGFGSELRDFVYAAEATGWLLVSRTGAGHFKLERSNPGGPPLIFTFSGHADSRARRNDIAKLQRQAKESGWVWCPRHKIMYRDTVPVCPTCLRQRAKSQPFNGIRVVPKEPEQETTMAETTPPPPSTPSSPRKSKPLVGGGGSGPRGRTVPFEQFNLLIEEGLKTGRWSKSGHISPRSRLFREAGYDNPTALMSQSSERGYVLGHTYDAFERLIFDGIKSRRVSGTIVRQPIALKSQKPSAAKALEKESAAAITQPPVVAYSAEASYTTSASPPAAPSRDDDLTSHEYSLLRNALAAQIFSCPPDKTQEYANLLAKLARLRSKKKSEG